MMVDEALHEIEEPEADQQAAAAGASSTTGGASGATLRQSDDQAEHDEDVGRRMEEPVQKRVDLEVLDARRRIPRSSPCDATAAPGEDDAVEEAAEAEPEEDAGRDRELALARIGLGHGSAA